MNGTSSGASDGIPGALLGVLALVALVVLAVLWGKAKDYGRAKAKQHVFARRDHRDGQELVAEELHFDLVAEPREIREAFLSSVRLAPQCPKVLADAYVLEATDDEVLVAFGSTLGGRTFTAGLTVRRSGPAEMDGPSAGRGRVDAVWSVRTWTLSDGVVSGVSVLRRLREDVEAALRDVDPGLRLVARRRSEPAVRD
ncbi:hypothetical protein ACKI1I_01290 [Streptomyces turgidiscabies]|uniref:Uncharacterized protein n=1 Tax=Streptomyces turgidiscabies (strain Car8) TaxID=698760 RepID=L7ETE3_STRT8|nr:MULTISPECIES: hypothetical protein [Streptomyces]ELP62683.1 hypothetical protein STRTUCAR8_05205 [Streptomyces turgidiscabies Car8]MDX3492467.1 hypothetical protein [Streptomyces turgidiscabies]GAQ69239.1 hypothetical protein T45_00961 [Streptomyces turgidiscabies]